MSTFASDFDDLLTDRMAVYGYTGNGLYNTLQAGAVPCRLETRDRNAVNSLYEQGAQTTLRDLRWAAAIDLPADARLMITTNRGTAAERSAAWLAVPGHFQVTAFPDGALQLRSCRVIADRFTDQCTILRTSESRDDMGGRETAWVDVQTVPCHVAPGFAPPQERPVGAQTRAAAQWFVRIHAGIDVRPEDRLRVAVASTGQLVTLEVTDIFAPATGSVFQAVQCQQPQGISED